MAHGAEILWERGEARFIDNEYSRAHRWLFDGGVVVPGSSSPHAVPLPWSDAAAVDPEGAFVAALASCHMLWLLSIAAKQQFRIDRYRDRAEGVLARNESGQWWLSQVRLRPAIVFSGEHLPTRADIDRLHHQAHEECYIAHSVRTEIRCEPVYES